MADAIMTFWNSIPSGVLSHIVIPVGIEDSAGSMKMQIEYNAETQGMHVMGVPGMGSANVGGFVQTPLGLVKQVNAYFKKVSGNSPDTPVLHVKSFRLYNDRTSYPNKVKDYEVQDLTRIQELFKTLTGKNASAVSNTPSGGQFPISCTVLNNDVYFYNIHGNPMNPIADVDVSHGENAFRGSMIANGFKLIP